MFRFQNPYESDPYFGGYRAQPVRRAQQPQYSPYEELFGGVHPSYAQQVEQRRRQEELYRRQQEELYLREQQALRAESERRMKAKLEKERERKERIAKAHKAATVIQRKVRAYLAKVRAERAEAQAAREAAASVTVTRVMRTVAAVKEARRIAASLRKLRTIEGSINAEFAAYKQRPCGYRNTLRFADVIEKKIISLDSVPRHRSTFVQERRRAIITEAQRALHYADLVQKMLVRKAAVVQRAVRRFLQVKGHAKADRAAKIITRALRAYPQIRRARSAAAQLREIREQSKALDALRTQYLQALREAKARLPAQSTRLSEGGEAFDALAFAAKALGDRVDREMAALSAQ